MTRNELDFMRGILYSLKRGYGFPLDLYKTTNSMDIETGRKNVMKTKYSVKRAVVLPGDLQRKHTFSRGYLAADKLFTYGASYDALQRQFIVDRNDLPINFSLDLSDYAVFEHKRYDIKSLQITDDGLAYIITGREAEGTVVGEIIDLIIFSKVRFIQRVQLG